MLPPASNPTLTDRKPQQLARCTASWSVHSRGGGGAAMCRSRDTLFASKSHNFVWEVGLVCRHRLLRLGKAVQGAHP